MKLRGQKIPEHAKAVVVDALAEVKSLSHSAQIDIFYAYGSKVLGNSIKKLVQIIFSAVRCCVFASWQRGVAGRGSALF